MELSEEECRQVLIAFDLLQAIDYLSGRQVEIVIKILDRYPDLDEGYQYLRDRYKGI